jgi:formamidopyrimidine-DNA glycosylase
MPELPDITAYLEALDSRISGRTLTRMDIAGVSLLRTAEPSPTACVGHKVTALRRIGKRIAIGFDNDIWMVLHLMIAGRLHWYDAKAAAKKPPKADGRRTLAVFSFDSGDLALTEAGTRKRASLHMVEGLAALAALDPGGIDVMTASLEDFSRVLTLSNHTMKRSLTDPHLFSGIGNAYSDEILHRAKLSPVLLTSRITPEEIARLYKAVRESLTEWIEILRKEAGGKFPEKVTAFRKEMAVHGRYGLPCPVCGTKVQRIRYASNETNYCPQCQTGGRLLADRALSRLLREDWPKSLDEMEEMRTSSRKLP